MQYMGGKSRLSAWIVSEAVRLVPDHPVWDPFCGGLSVAVAFAKAGRTGKATDKHPALIALYRAVADGWDPPSVLSEADYKLARTLPDSDPLKAFAGFGCSFGGKYFGGYARCARESDYCAYARNSLLRDLPLLIDAGWTFECLDFLTHDIELGTRQLIYCDPPYKNSTGYSTGAFDHKAFWARCSLWSRAGATVLVSEYTGEGHVIAERQHNLGMTGTTGSVTNARTEKLFLCR